MQISITGGSGYLAGRICEFFSKNLSNKIFLISRTPEKHLVSKNIFAINLSDKSAFEQCISSSDIVIFTAGYNSHMASRDPNGAIKFDIHLLGGVKSNKKKYNINISFNSVL